MLARSSILWLTPQIAATVDAGQICSQELAMSLPCGYRAADRGLVHYTTVLVSTPHQFEDSERGSTLWLKLPFMMLTLHMDVCSCPGCSTSNPAHYWWSGKQWHVAQVFGLLLPCRRSERGFWFQPGNLYPSNTHTHLGETEAALGTWLLTSPVLAAEAISGWIRWDGRSFISLSLSLCNSAFWIDKNFKDLFNFYW